MISAPPLLMQASSSGPKPAAVYRHGHRHCTVIRCAVAVAVAPAASSGDMHEVLGLRAGSTRREIRAAYRRLARERHPDAAGSADDDGDFIRLHDAYAALYDRAVVAHAFARPPATRPRRTWETDQCW